MHKRDYLSSHLPIFRFAKKKLNFYCKKHYFSSSSACTASSSVVVVSMMSSLISAVDLGLSLDTRKYQPWVLLVALCRAACGIGSKEKCETANKTDPAAVDPALWLELWRRAPGAFFHDGAEQLVTLCRPLYGHGKQIKQIKVCFIMNEFLLFHYEWISYVRQ